MSEPDGVFTEAIQKICRPANDSFQSDRRESCAPELVGY